jgi:hypothetical protein
MRVDRQELVGGGTIDVLVPENAADLAELDRLERAGELDSRLSFADGDDDDPPPRRRRRSRRSRSRSRR